MKGQAVLNGVAGRALGLKVGAFGAAVFLVFLVLLGFVSGGGESAADSGSCPGNADVGDVGDTGLPPSQDQITNAKIIDGVAVKRKLPGRATLIALMTALQESGLRNIDYGDRDSVGLFQQRPSAGWGSVAQIMNPEYSANAFFGGRGAGHPRGLVDIKDWQLKPLGVVAQAVQVSAFPDLYAPREGQARTIAGQAGIDLERAGGATGEPVAPIDGGTSCGDGGEPGKPGEPFHDGAADWPAQVKNPRSTADAIAWAKKEAHGGPDWYRMCLAFTARSYGWGFSGTAYAIDHYQKVMPASMRHDGDRKPPPGALMYWDTGSRAGHVAVYVGEGKIASNDIRRPGYIDVVPATDPETKWGATYLGWSPPYYPNGG